MGRKRERKRERERERVRERRRANRATAKGAIAKRKTVEGCFGGSILTARKRRRKEKKRTGVWNRGPVNQERSVEQR